MSFSSNIKEELSRNETGARHCKIAEIAGFLRFGGISVWSQNIMRFRSRRRRYLPRNVFIHLSKMCLIFMRRLMLDETNF